MGDTRPRPNRRPVGLSTIKGGAAPLLLGAALFLFVGTAAAGGLELLRVTGARVLVHRSLQAAAMGAAQTLTLSGPAQAEQAFWELLRADLDLDTRNHPRSSTAPLAGPVQAQVLILPDGGADPFTGRRWEGPAVAAVVRWPYRPLFLPLQMQIMEARYGVQAP